MDLIASNDYLLPPQKVEYICVEPNVPKGHLIIYSGTSALPRGVVVVPCMGTNIIGIHNTTNKEYTIHKGQVVATAIPLKEEIS